MDRACITALVFLLSVASLQARLVAHWDFSDGDYADKAGSLNGTPVGTVSIVAVTETNVPFSKAVQTAASGLNANYLNIGNLGSLGVYTNSFTLSMWIKRDLPAGTTSPEFWESYSGASGAYEGIVGALRGAGSSDPGKAYISVGGAGTATSLLKGGVVADGNWHWLVIRYDGDKDQLKYFEDGVHRIDRDVTRVASLTQLTARDCRIGDGFGGLVGDVRIYDTALSFTTDGSNNLTDGELLQISIPVVRTFSLFVIGMATP
jgi:hypothetical protein